MSELTQEQLVERLGNMSVMELCQLTKTLEEKWGVTAAPPTALPPGDLPRIQPPVEEKSEFDVTLVAAPADKKIAVIKVVREVLGLGLKEAKDLVDNAPRALKSGISKADADEISKKIVEAGGQVQIT